VENKILINAMLPHFYFLKMLLKISEQCSRELGDCVWHWHWKSERKTEAAVTQRERTGTGGSWFCWLQSPPQSHENKITRAKI